MSFIDDLQPASFRGVPFGVLMGESRFGRRLALHEYPFKDTPWPEDLGRATRKFAFKAFLVTDSIVYGGGDVIAQREALVAACEAAGTGTLIHPTYGRLTVSCPEDGCIITEQWDEGRYFEVQFNFIEGGEREFPTATTATTDNSNSSADQTDVAAGSDFTTRAQVALAEGNAVIKQAEMTAASWVDMVTSLASDATGLFTTVATLPGNFGRYFAGGTVGYAGKLTVPGAPTTVAGLIAAGITEREAVTEATDALLTAAAGSDAATTATAAQGAAAALLGATIDPAVAARLLTALAAFYPAQATTPSPVGTAMAVMQAAFGALARRAALAALVRASALYQPASRDDAAIMRDQIATLLDEEITIAGDSGDDATYAAMRVMRGAMVLDLNSRGASLPPMQVFTFAANFPALVLAQRLYQDASRNDELTLEANPRHPAFMPTAFSALAS